MNKRWLTAVGVVGMLLALFVLLARSAPAGANGPGAQALETRLLAPCCWNGTLDTHDSELAHSLRHEIEARIAAGEKSEAVEADLVSRYGSKIRALPREGTLNLMLAGAFVLVVAAGIFGATRVRAWRRSTDELLPVGKAAPLPARIPDAYDARIDAELADVD